MLVKFSSAKLSEHKQPQTPELEALRLEISSPISSRSKTVCRIPTGTNTRNRKFRGRCMKGTAVSRDLTRMLISANLSQNDRVRKVI